MSISGNLETMEPAELLQWVAQSTKTGTLVIENEGGEIRIFFRDGRIIATSSDDPAARLGQYLLGRSLLDEGQLSAALEKQKASSEPLGTLLLDQGFVTEEDLRKVLVQKAEDCVFELFLTPEGAFHFEQEQPLTGETEISIDVTGLVLKAAERADEWKRIGEIIPSNRCVPVAVGFLDGAGLEPAAQRVLSLVNDDRDVEEICAETHLSEHFVGQTLFSMLEMGKLKIVRPKAEITQAEVDVDAVGAPTHLEIADRLIVEGTFPTAMRHLNAARSLDPQGKQTAQAVEAAEDRIRRALESEGIEPQAIPSLNRSPDEIPELRLSPEEGFVMSRIDGAFDIDSILKISPMPQLDAQLVFRKLLQAGHINLDRPDD